MILPIAEALARADFEPVCVLASFVTPTPECPPCPEGMECEACSPRVAVFRSAGSELEVKFATASCNGLAIGQTVVLCGSWHHESSGARVLASVRAFTPPPPSPAADAGAEKILPIAEAMARPDFEPVCVKAMLVRLAPLCPPCPQRARCEACLPPWATFRSGGSELHVELSGARDVSPGHEVVLCGYWHRGVGGGRVLTADEVSSPRP